VRYDDLRRWKEAEKKLNGDMYGMNYSGKDAERGIGYLIP